MRAAIKFRNGCPKNTRQPLQVLENFLLHRLVSASGVAIFFIRETIMPSQFLPQARTAHLIVQTLDDEILLFDSVADRAHVLNQTSAVVWKLANGKRTVEQLSQLTARELQAQPDTDLIWLALTQLS